MQGPLSAELEAAAMRALETLYEELNGSLFGGALRRPVLILSAADGRLGAWCGSTRHLELARSLVCDQPWTEVSEVLKHEMAHQYVDEVLGLPAGPHGAAFRRVCEARGIDARASGRVGDGAQPPTRMMERIRRLLALAESPNVHEAESAAAIAQRLMLKHNIQRVETRRREGYTFRHLGRPSGRVHQAQRLLATILDEHFFVEAIWVPVWRAREGRRGSTLEICGTEENVEVAAYVHGFLTHTSEQLWQEHRTKQPGQGGGSRLQYLAGVMAGFRDKLRRDAGRSAGAGLIWRGDPQTRAYLRRRHPHVHTRRYAGAARSEAFASGHEAGQRIVVRRGMTAAPTPTGGRMLPP